MVAELRLRNGVAISWCGRGARVCQTICVQSLRPLGSVEFPSLELGFEHILCLILSGGVAVVSHDGRVRRNIVLAPICHLGSNNTTVGWMLLIVRCLKHLTLVRLRASLSYSRRVQRVFPLVSALFNMLVHYQASRFIT